MEAFDISHTPPLTADSSSNPCHASDPGGERGANDACPPANLGLAAKGCIFKDGRMLVLHKPQAARKRSAVPHREEDLPGGCVEPGESLVEALAREVMEETGLAIEIDRPFNTWSLQTPVRQIIGVDFICFWKEGEVQLSWEHESYEWLTLDEIRSRGWETVDVYEAAFELAQR